MKKNVLKILDKETLIKNILIIPKIPWKQGQGLKINEKTRQKLVERLKKNLCLVRL